MFRRSGNKKQYFGSPVDQNSGVVPTLISRSVDFLNQYLEEPGLFRISGQQQVINEIRQQWDKGQSPTFDAKTSPHNVAGLLKLYLREMPEPLFTHARYPLFIDSASKPTYEARVEFTSGLLQGLPPTFFKASQQVLGLLYNIASNSEVNNMDAKNLATVFVQCIIRPKVQSFDYFVTEAPPLNSTLTFIIENYPVLFGVPGKCLPPRQPKGAAAAAAAAAAAGATSTDPTATAAAPGAPGDIPPPPGAGADAVPPPPPPVLGGEEETPDPGVDPAVWAFRSESYKVITQLYELTNVIIDELANVQSVSELVFLASVVWEARTAITKELTETLVPPAFTLVAVQPPASRARLQQLLAEHGDTISRFTEDIAGYVEQMGQYMSEVETLEPLRPVDARFRFLAAVLAQSERVTRRHEGVSPTATATDDTVDTAVLDNFLPDDVPSTTEDPAAAGALPPPPPPPLPSDGDVAAPGTELPPPPPPPAADEPALGVPPPPVPAVPPQLGVPPAVPPAAAAAPEPQLGLPPVAPAAAAAPEPQLGLPPVAPAAAATAPEPQLGLPPVAPAAAPEPQLGLPPAAPASQTPAGGQNTQFVPAMANTAALNKTWAPGVSAAAPPPAAKTAEAPVNTLLLATGGRKPAGNIGTSQRRAPGTGNAKNPTGDMLYAPIAGIIDILKFMRNDALTASPAQRKTLLDVAHRLELIVANPFKDMAELMMMDASMGGSGNSNSTQALGAACEKTIATLQRILPLCKTDMPVLQAQLVATLARRITEVIYNRDKAELALFA